MKEELLEKLASELTIEDMPNEAMKHIAEACGIEVARALLVNMSGGFIYVPNSWKGTALQRYVKKKFNGSNARELAVETGYSQTHIYTMLRSRKVLEGQLDMFEEGSNDDDNSEGK